MQITMPLAQSKSHFPLLPEVGRSAVRSDHKLKHRANCQYLMNCCCRCKVCGNPGGGCCVPKYWFEGSLIRNICVRACLVCAWFRGRSNLGPPRGTEKTYKKAPIQTCYPLVYSGYFAYTCINIKNRFIL